MSNLGLKLFIAVVAIIEVYCIVSLIRMFSTSNKNKSKRMTLIDVEDSGSIFDTSGIGVFLSFFVIIIACGLFIYAMPIIMFFQMKADKAIGPGREMTFVFRDENDEVHALKTRSEMYRLVGLKDVRIGDVCDINNHGSNITKAKIEKSKRYQ